MSLNVLKEALEVVRMSGDADLTAKLESVITHLELNSLAVGGFYPDDVSIEDKEMRQRDEVAYCKDNSFDLDPLTDKEIVNILVEVEKTTAGDDVDYSDIRYAIALVRSDRV